MNSRISLAIIVRYTDYECEGVAQEHCIDLHSCYSDPYVADQEAARLNRVRRDDGINYFVKVVPDRRREFMKADDTVFEVSDARGEAKLLTNRRGVYPGLLIGRDALKALMDTLAAASPECSAVDTVRGWLQSYEEMAIAAELESRR